jgi:hypothetical protein
MIDLLPAVVPYLREVIRRKALALVFFLVLVLALVLVVVLAKQLPRRVKPFLLQQSPMSQ